MTNNPIDTMQLDTTNHYQVCVECSNCKLGKNGLLSEAFTWIPNGQKLVDTPCPKCKCKTLSLNKDQYYISSQTLTDE